MPNILNCFYRPRPAAWITFLIAFALTVGAGTWQVERLAWKESLTAKLTAANDEAPLKEIPTSKAVLDTLQFRKVSVHGTWLDKYEFDIAPRYLRNQFGYAVVTPLKLTDGRIILVNRGWVPAAKKNIESRPESKVHGHATVTGLMRLGDERSYFTPANQPEKNIWFGRDEAEMAGYANLDKVIPAMLDQVGDATTEKLPVPSDGVIRLRNDHLSYIITWYSIAAGILIIFLVYHRKK